MVLPTPTGASISALLAVLPFFGIIVAGLFGYFGARFTATAPLQGSLNDAFRIMMKERQDELERLREDHASFTVRIFELEGEIIRQRGVINNHLAKEDALLRILEKNDIKPPEGHSWSAG